MSKEETLKTYLEALTGKSVYADEKPIGNLDCIVYKRVSTKRFRTQTGTTSTERVRFQINVYGENKSDVRELMETIKNDLDGNHTDFSTATLENDFDTKDVDGDKGLYWGVLDFYVW